MITTSGATVTVPAAVPASGSAKPPQRQSCDRCHKQKLRCIRNNNNGDVCDRCSSKRVQCVYSSSLPKGRPSLRRLAAEGPNMGSSAMTDDTTSAKEVTSPVLRCLPDSSEIAPPPILPQLMNTSAHLSMATWPWTGTTSWEDTPTEMSWDGLNFSRADIDEFLANTNSFENSSNGREDSNPNSMTESGSNSSSPQTRGYMYGQPRDGQYERRDEGYKSNVETSMGSNMASVFPDENSGVAIGLLSQLSVHLSSLRSSSHILAQAADSSFGTGLNDVTFSLVDSAAFGSITTWLASEENSVESTHSWPSFEAQIKLRSGQSILRDLFSASHRLMEILRHLKADDIIRHLVMACEALLLEIYAAVLTALQHEAYPGDSMNATALGNVRLVIIVQLCAYLIDRQHQAVRQCLAPSTVQKSSLLSPLPSSSYNVGTADKECLKDLRVQVQQKLTRLRQMLRCA